MVADVEPSTGSGSRARRRPGIDPARPPAARRSVLLTGWLFTICFVMAQADKQVMGLLAIPLQDHFHLTNTELGFLQGGAFAIAYALGGLPIGRLLDTGNRVRIAAACVAIWSIATFGSGLATTFGALLLFRAATAIAEAGLPPAAFSVFAQSGDQRSLIRLTSAFMLAPFIGGGLVLLLGGQLLKALAGMHHLPILADEHWRAVFIAVGAPGLILALLLGLLGTEPQRGAARQRSVLPGNWQVLRAIFVEQPRLRFYYLATTSFYVVAAALMAWFPAFLVRHFAASTAAAGGYAGLTYLASGVIGTLAVNLLARIRRKVDQRVMMRDFLIAAIVIIPLSIAIPFAPQLAVCLALYAIYGFVSAIIISTMPVPIQVYLPEDMRARGTAIASLMMSGLAGTAGPIFVGLLVDRAGFSLGASIATVCAGASVAAAAFYAAALRHAHSPAAQATNNL